MQNTYTKETTTFLVKLFARLSCLATVFMLLMAGTALAQGFARGYVTEDQDLQPGMVVSLSASSTADTPKVERSTPENLKQVVGVATELEDNLATLASGEHQVYIQTSGSVTALISDLNGEVKQGDRVTVSSLRGVLMLVDGSSSSVGVALEDFDDQNAESRTIQTPEGAKSVKVAKSDIEFTKSISTSGKQENRDTSADSALQRLGRAAVGKEVSDLQVITALVIFLIVMIAEGSIIYGAVSSAVTSIGRNPLSKNLIKSELFRVLGLAIIVLLVGLASIYAVLII